MLDSIVQLDQNVSLALNSLHTPVTDSMWMFFSARNPWIPMYILVAALMIWRLGWKKGLSMILLTALCILCVDQLANLVKFRVARLRPCNDPSIVDRGLHILAKVNNSKYGFFSAHAGNAMGFAVCSSAALRMNKKTGRINYPAIYSVFIYCWAVMVGLSRVFVAKHYLGDVLVGFAAGAAIGAFLICLFKACTSKAALTAA